MPAIVAKDNPGLAAYTMATSGTNDPLVGGILGPCAAHSPRARHQRNGAVWGKGQPRADALAQGGASLVAQRHYVAGRRPLPAEERQPVVVKIPEVRRDVDSARLHLGEAGPLEELGERRGPAQRKAPPLIQVELLW